MNKVVKDILNKLRTDDKSIETDTVDIKGEWYSNTKKTNWKDDLIKDVCAFANNVEGKTGHLVFGLKETSPHLNSIAIQEDEATIQQIVSRNINPVPKIALDRITIEGAQIYVLSVSVEILDLPYFAKQSDGNHFIYIRRGSSTDQCRKEDHEKMLTAKREQQIDIEIEAKALAEIKKLEYDSRNLGKENWEELLDELRLYSDGYSQRTSEEVLNVLIGIASYLGKPIKAEIAPSLSEIASNTLGFIHFKIPLKRELTTHQFFILDRAIDLGWSIGYEGTRRLQSPPVVGAGTCLLWKVLRFAHLNKLTDMKTKALNTLDGLEDWATKNNFDDAVQWIRFIKDDALALNDESLPEFPSEISKKFS